jgi:RimJ/RimL family protein N-acetyltransferase
LVIQTERLLLRPWREEDRGPFAVMNADTKVRRFYPSLLTREESDASIERYQAMYKRDGFCFFAAELRATSTFIGCIGLQTMTFEVPRVSQPAVEIGWRLTPEVWGRGLAPEGAHAVLRFAFEQQNLSEVVAITTPANLPSRRVMEKLGMTHHPQDVFDHPNIAAGHPLQRHVLYRIRKDMMKPEVDGNPSSPR